MRGDASFHHNHLWLWVPAFAGTTEDYGPTFR